MTRLVVPVDERAVEFVSGSRASCAVLTCEHASEHFPAPYALIGDDARLVGTHWAYDPGAAELTRELASLLDAPAVLARFSRLVVDPNRDVASVTLLRDVADGMPIALNVDVPDEDRALRIARFYAPYHDAVDRMVAASSAPLVFPLHTFTDCYEGSLRPMEVGVLFDREDELGHALHERLLEASFVSALNEPWSGKEGLIYSAERHSVAHGRRALEIEVRQDRAVDPAFRARLLPVVAAFLREHGSRLAAASGTR